MNADGMVAYYEPLYEWLKEENARLGLNSGWDSSKNEFYPFEDMEFIGKCADEEKSTFEPNYSTQNFLRQFVKP